MAICSWSTFKTWPWCSIFVCQRFGCGQKFRVLKGVKSVVFRFSPIHGELPSNLGSWDSSHGADNPGESVSVTGLAPIEISGLTPGKLTSYWFKIFKWDDPPSRDTEILWRILGSCIAPFPRCVFWCFFLAKTPSHCPCVFCGTSTSISVKFRPIESNHLLTSKMS